MPKKITAPPVELLRLCIQNHIVRVCLEDRKLFLLVPIKMKDTNALLWLSDDRYAAMGKKEA